MDEQMDPLPPDGQLYTGYQQFCYLGLPVQVSSGLPSLQSAKGSPYVVMATSNLGHQVVPFCVCPHHDAVYELEKAIHQALTLLTIKHPATTGKMLLTVSPKAAKIMLDVWWNGGKSPKSAKPPKVVMYLKEP